MEGDEIKVKRVDEVSEEDLSGFTRSPNPYIGSGDG